MSYNPNVKDTLLNLQAIGYGEEKDKYNNIPVILYSTVFFNPSSTIEDQAFFNSVGLDEQWQSRFFPNNTQAFQITHLQVEDALQFTVSNALRNPEYMKSFANLSRLEIRNEGNEVLEVSLDELLTYKFIFANNTTGTTATYTEIKEKFSSWYQLARPIFIGAGQQPDIRLRVAKGFTTGAYTANIAPVITQDQNSGLTTSGQGYYIKLKMFGVKSKVNA